MFILDLQSHSAPARAECELKSRRTSMSGNTAPIDSLECCIGQARRSRPEIAAWGGTQGDWREIGLEDRTQHQLQRILNDSIRDSRCTELSQFPNLRIRESYVSAPAAVATNRPSTSPQVVKTRYPDDFFAVGDGLVPTPAVIRPHGRL